jgi:drug/metabolite transporter (DMT)-like permease
MSGVTITSTTDARTSAVAWTSWLPGLVLLAAIWGCSFLFISVGIRELPPTYVTLARVTTGAVTLLVVLAVTRQRLPRSRRLWAHLVVAGAFGVALPFTLFGYGEQRVPSLLAGIWNGTTPLVVLPLAVLCFRTERFTLRRLAGLAIGFLGVLVVLGVWRGVGGAALAGQLMCFGAAACYGFAIPYQKRFLTDSGESGIALSAGLLIAATVEIAVVAPLVAGAPPDPLSLSWNVVASVLALGALGTGIAFVIHMRNIRLVGASTASLVTYIVPVFAIVVGVVVLGEQVRWYEPVGALVVLTGVAVSQGLFARPDVEHEPVAPPDAAVEPCCDEPGRGARDRAGHPRGA